eukprot:143158_1
MPKDNTVPPKKPADNELDDYLENNTIQKSDEDSDANEVTTADENTNNKNKKKQPLVIPKKKKPKTWSSNGFGRRRRARGYSMPRMCGFSGGLGQNGGEWDEADPAEELFDKMGHMAEKIGMFMDKLPDILDSVNKPRKTVKEKVDSDEE